MNPAPDQLRRPPITESPWFWLALFGGVGLLGVMVIGPKWVLRTSRIERMQGTRERVALERARGSEAAASPEPLQRNSAQAEPSPAFEHEPYVPSDQGPPLKLVGLAAIMIVLMVTGVGGLLVTRHRGPVSVAPTPDSSPSTSSPSHSSLSDSPGAATL